jgi:hypothetical protein
MNTTDFLQNVIYPALATLITAGVGFAVMYIRAMTATQKQVADAGQLQQVLARGAALAKTESDEPAVQAAKVTEYLHETAPDLAVRTGMATQDFNANLVPTEGAVRRVDATLAVANAPAAPQVIVPVIPQ